MPHKDPEQRKEYMRKWREKNSNYDRLYRQENKDKIREDKKRWASANRDKENAIQRRKYHKNLDYYREYKRNYTNARRRFDLEFKSRSYLRSRLYNALKGQYKISSAISDLGCSLTELRKHLENQFQPGMSWENYGKWHIDHIRPLSSFDLTDREQFLRACHYTNLQPLWAEDNLRKGDKTT